MDAQRPRAAFGLRPDLTPPPVGWPGGGGQAPAGMHSGMSLPVSWSGSPWSLTGLSFLNFFLSIATLGIYSFWGRTEVRKRVWSSVRLAGEPLEYTGTGKELFLGFLFVIAVVFLPLVLIGVVLAFVLGPNGAAVVQLAFYAVFFYLFGVALYRARRYRLSRTNWRGIRGSLVGNSWGYGWTSLWTLAIIPVVIMVGVGIASAIVGPSIVGQTGQMMATKPWLAGGILLATLIAWLWLVPWRSTKLYRQITNDMTFGDRPFSFVGSARPLYARFVARWVGVVILAIATVAAMYAVGLFEMFKEMAATAKLPDAGKRMPTPREGGWLIGILLTASFLYSIITAWYRAAQANIFAVATRYEGVPLKLGVTAGGLIWLVVSNYLVMIAPAVCVGLIALAVSLAVTGMTPTHIAVAGLFTTSILRPVVEARTAKYFVERFAFDGPIDISAIAQSQAALDRTGEGLAQAFDVDAF